MRGFILGLSVSVAFIVGCVAGSSRFFVPPASAQQQAMAPRWEYMCADVGGYDGVMAKANQAGSERWEMVAATFHQFAASFVCFKRPRP